MHKFIFLSLTTLAVAFVITVGSIIWLKYSDRLIARKALLVRLTEECGRGD